MIEWGHLLSQYKFKRKMTLHELFNSEKRNTVKNMEIKEFISNY